MARSDRQDIFTAAMRESSQDRSAKHLRASVALVLADYRNDCGDETAADERVIALARKVLDPVGLAELMHDRTEALRALIGAYANVLSATDEEIAAAIG